MTFSKVLWKIDYRVRFSTNIHINFKGLKKIYVFKKFFLIPGHLLCILDDHTKLVRCLSFAPDGSQVLVSGSNDGTLKLWDLDDDGNMTHTFHTPLKNIVHCCKFSPHAKYLAACGEKRLVSRILKNKLIYHYVTHSWEQLSPLAL